MNRLNFTRAVVAVACSTIVGCSKPSPNGPPEVLLFNGSGASINSVAAVERILQAQHLEYAKANSDQLNHMSVPQLAAYRLIIIPGGNYITIGNSLTVAAAANVHDAVKGGLNYLGICAGGILAGKAPGRNFDLTSGARFGFYAVVNQGVHKTNVMIARPGAPSIEHYWEDGPQFSGWGAVAGKYPDGTPAIVEGESGKGWVVLCGVHPEAPESWRRGMDFSMPASAANAHAVMAIESALHRTSLRETK